MSNDNPRDHGYGKSPEVVGAPILGKQKNHNCPNCGCNPVFMVEVELKDAPPELRRPAGPHKIIGTYMGCAACPWASPMMTTTRPTS